MSNPFVHHISEMLSIGRKLVENQPVKSAETGTTNVKGDRTLQMAVIVQQALFTYAKENRLPVDIYSEEVGFLKVHSHPTHMLVFDPLDGSSNYKVGHNFFPYGLMISIYKGLKPKLQDVVASGLIEYTTDKSFLYDGEKTVDSKNQPVKIKLNWPIHKSTPVHFDLYYPEAYKTFSLIPGKLHIHWGGSNASSLLYILSGVTSAVGALSMRPEEIGTMVSLIKGAGGIACDHQGRDLGWYPFSTDKTFPLLAGDPKIVKFVVEELRKLNG